MKTSENINDLALALSKAQRVMTGAKKAISRSRTAALPPPVGMPVRIIVRNLPIRRKHPVKIAQKLGTPVPQVPGISPRLIFQLLCFPCSVRP